MNSPRIEISARDEIAVAEIDGEIDIANASAVAEALLHAVAEQPIGLVVDLSSLRYLDSGGVRMFFQVAAQLATARRRMALVVPEASPLNRLVKITGLHEAAWVGPSREACRDAMLAEVHGSGR